MLAPVILAMALSQGCPEPPSRNGPPPCAAQNVPGCLPGYVRDYDRYGRVIYRCDSNYARPAPAPQQFEPQAQGLPPVPPPEPYAAPAPAPPAPRYARPYVAPYGGYGERGVVGLVLMPGATTTRDRGNHAEATGAIALELRGPRTGGGRVRFGYEAAPFGRIADLALKYDFNDNGEVRPFLAVGAGAASVDPEPGWHFTAAGSAGVDLYPTRNFFVTVELKQRIFTHRAVGPGNGLEQSGLPQTALFFGVGLYL
jgi:hypothetical protein